MVETLIMTREEFDIFSGKVRGKLISVAGRINLGGGQPVEAEDIVQDALVRLWELSERGYPVNNPKALAIKITKNLCVSRYRKSQKDAIRLETADKPGGETAADFVEAADNQRIKESLYHRLTPARQECIILRNDFGMSLDEIAETTGRPKESVKVLISTARKQMLEQIKELL